jgi:hypothetical protein
MEYFIIGALAGLLVTSAAWNFALLKTRHSTTRVWRERARLAEDRQRAAELRAAQQIDAMLDRISSPVLAPAKPAMPEVDPTQRKHISDFPVDDDVWNEYRGNTEDEVE